MEHKPSSKLVRVMLATSALTLILTGTAQTARAQDEFARLEATWKRGDYARSFPALVRYRLRTKIKNEQIDYMIATSACRTPEHRQNGNSYFGWMLDNYPLSNQNRGIIEYERGRCSTSAPPQQLRSNSPASLVGIMYRGKGGTAFNATSSGNSPTEVVNSIPPEIFQSRLFPLSQSETALRSLRSQFGSDSEIERVGYFLLVVPASQRTFAFPDSPDNRLPARLEIPNRAATPNEGVIPNPEASPNRAATPNSSARPNSSVQANRPAEVTQKAPPTNPGPPPNPSQVPNAASPVGVTPATPNAPGVAPTRAVPPNNAAPPSPNPSQVPHVVLPGSGPIPQMVQRPLSTAAETEKSDLTRVGEDLQKYAQFFVSEYGMATPPHLITVYFAPNADELRTLATKIHGIALTPGSIGYSFPGDQSMVGWADGKAYGTFAHELFHLMVRGNFGDAPPWLDEGMAALYEVSKFEGDRAVGVSNWRGKILSELWAIRPSLKQLVQMSRKDFDDVDSTPHVSDGTEKLVAGARQAVNHATARYFMLYLQERSQLRPVYQGFFKREVSDQPGSKAVELIESVLRRSLDQVDQDFARWFKSLPN